MNAATETGAQVPPVMIAALLLAARSELIRLGLPHPGADEVFAATGAGRTRAYKQAAMIPNALAGLVRPTGRPPSPPPAPSADSTLSRRVLAYLMDHSGSVTGRGHRRSYSTGFRCFILALIEEHPKIDLTVFASSVGVPLPTLRDWLHAGCPTPEPPKEENLASDEAATAHVETIVRQWEHWQGEFVPFCDHLRQNLHLPYGRTLIAGILEQLGLRTPCRRSGRSPDEKAMQEAFETFFPGAQWQGDGSPIVVRVFGQDFVFNLELMVDVRTGAVTGVSVRDHEDGAAVIEAFDQGVGTTGSKPIVLELDGRPPNHSDEVVGALGETILMASTPGRPQSNPFVEGAHSLFQNAAPALAIEQAPARDVARQLLELTATVWARVLNHKPRLDRGGRSRAQLYQEETPTEDQDRQARDSLRKRCRRQDRALETLRRRQNPVVLEMLGSNFERLGLDDSKGNVSSAIARYPLNHILAGLAIYEAKQQAGTLPSDVDARYLLGIVRNVSHKDEGQLITEALLRLHLEARDLMLSHLAQALEQLRAATTDRDELLRAMIKYAMVADRQLDRLFWLGAAAELILSCPQIEQADLVRAAGRRIHANFVVPYSDRLAAVRVLTRKVVPLG